MAVGEKEVSGGREEVRDPGRWCLLLRGCNSGGGAVAGRESRWCPSAPLLQGSFCHLLTSQALTPTSLPYEVFSSFSPLCSSSSELWLRDGVCLPITRGAEPRSSSRPFISQGVSIWAVLAEAGAQ